MSPCDRFLCSLRNFRRSPISIVPPSIGTRFYTLYCFEHCSVAIWPESEYGWSVSLASCREILTTDGSLRHQTALLNLVILDVTPQEPKVARKWLARVVQSGNS